MVFQPVLAGSRNIDIVCGSNDEIPVIEIAAFCEENKVPFIFQILHYSTPFLSLKTIEGMLKAAPNMCKGFAFSETWPSAEIFKNEIMEYFEACSSDEYVQADLPWSGFTVSDRITGENLEVHNQRFKVSIPAGAFRILEVRRSN